MSSKGDWFGGTNLQNPSPNVAKIYYADEGHKFVQRDQSGAEALVVAYESGGGRLLDLFNYGIKPHVFVALHRFAEHWESLLSEPISPYLKASPKELAAFPNWKKLDRMIKEDSERYALGKMLCHASNYGMGANEFRINVLVRTGGTMVLSHKEADLLISMYHELFPEIRAWHQRLLAVLKETRTLRNLQGYPRLFTGAWSDGFEKEAIAFTPQSTVGTITNDAVVEVYEHIESNHLPWIILNNKHDSFMLECPESDVATASAVMKTAINRPLISSFGVRFSMKSECQVGDNWGKYSETNPLGMKEFTE